MAFRRWFPGALLVLLAVGCTAHQGVVVCSPCAGPQATVDLRPLVGRTAAPTTAQLCVREAGSQEECGEKSLLPTSVSTPPTPDITTTPASPRPTSTASVPYTSAAVSVIGLDGHVSLAELSVVLTIAGGRPTRITVQNPKSYDDSCSCGSEVGDTFHSYAYRLMNPVGPLLPAR
jgi:hypothetical protein